MGQYIHNWDNGKENGNYYNIWGFYRVYIGAIGYLGIFMQVLAAQVSLQYMILEYSDPWGSAQLLKLRNHANPMEYLWLLLSCC